MKKGIVFLSIIGAVVSCAPQLSILHLNDTHSHMEPVREEYNYGWGGVIERGAIVDSVRTSRGENNVLLLHAGDFNQGTSYFTQFGGIPEVQSLNAFRYDCVTLGNHEFDNGVEDLSRRLRMINCPVVCANLKLEGTALQGVVEPYTIVYRAGRKIGIIGLTSDLSSNVAYEISSQLVQYDALDVTNRYASYLKGELNCDMVILLSHLGFGEDEKLIPGTKDIDVVVGGHTHTKITEIHYVKNSKGRKIPIVTDECWGYSVGELIVK